MAEQKKPRYFLWAIMLLLCVGLLGFGTGGFNSNVRSIGTVGDKDVSVTSYRNALNQQLSAFESQLGSRITFQEAESLGVVALAQSQLITARTLDNEAMQMGLSVGDERVREEVLRVPSFRGLDGSFDREAYRSALRRNGITEALYETSIRESAARTILQSAIVGGITAPEAYTDQLVQFYGEQRDFVFANLTADDLETAIAAPTDEDLRAFFEANPDLFTTSEAREISFAWLTPDMIQDDLQIEEDTLRQIYNDRIAEFVQPERRLVERLVFVDEASATAAKAQLDAGEIDFDALVEERGLDLADVDLGDVDKDELGAAGEAVFGAEAGDVVGPLNSSIGPALFRMNAVLNAQETSFEDAADQLRVEASADRARRVIDGSVEFITDLLVGGASLEELANETDMQFGQISLTPDSADEIAAYGEFRVAASTASESDFPAINNLSDGGIFALRLDGVTPPSVIPFEGVREQVIAFWTADQEREAVVELAEEMSTQIDPLTDFASLDLASINEFGLTRRSFVEGTPPAFITEVFATPLSETVVVETPTGAIIARVDAINPPNPENTMTSAEREQISGLAQGGIAQDLFDAYAGAVQRRTDVQLDAAIIDAVHSQFQ
ncbi:peptidyl-prolyl cis-trans isomerase [Cognatiyoonia sp.]|uniref:peptidyl-prolyl cis-trans isomerase n=1 Tax=Cognatiyoonia sp. TaxID=2211652 RepID=UPI003F698505